jgi:Methyltransferase domain
MSRWRPAVGLALGQSEMNIHKIPAMRYFRTKRMRDFVGLFAINDEHQIIDVGGSELNWTLIPEKPSITIVNINAVEYTKDRIKSERGDARRLRFDDARFDIAYSNSAVEHVGSWSDQKEFATEVRRVVARYYVQTPNRDFFMEPHLVAPFIHFVPKRVARKLVRHCTLHGLVARPTQKWIDEFLPQTRLLNARELQQLFPDAYIIPEKVFGLTKSFIAIRR